ncbi:tRNA pseudouridine(55) synthase TruB [candidate division WOR-3 bacterium]|nr:tRNA pseudouridine(55) synthase TruB [candidate division WOR-3 bacterium]
MDLILNIDKDPQIASFDVVRKLRKRLHIKKCGYTGILDPFASGVLPVFTGNFTKLIPFLNNKNKEYKFNIALGYQTDTLDITGKIVKEMDVPTTLTKNIIESVIFKYFSGKIIQIPPVYSALKVNGERAYNLARKNIDFKLKPREVEIFSTKIESVHKNGFEGTIKVAKGFYVRSFARDIAEKLNTAGTLIQLKRLSDGEFRIDESINVESVKESDTYDVLDLMENYMMIMTMNRSEIKNLRNGQSVFFNNNGNGLCIVTNYERESIIIGYYENNSLTPKRIII